uniref:EFHC1 n=1 Tax=Phallusia mammillata TaxID=59560 RepID=A0A6F9DBU4_9ASCI|nr:EFHC1 [Phallusia mammillata]
MATTRAEGLPFLPGNTFEDPTKTRYHVTNTLKFKNGYAQQHSPVVGLGGERLTANQLSEAELDELANKMPTLTYGQAKQAPPETFVPAHLAFDKKVLKFIGYFKETVHESPQEYYRVRPVEIFYYLEDDSISVVEPNVENSGMPQGKLIKRQRLPKDDQGNHWHWKDLNLGMNVVFYGKSFRITNCDKFTLNFMESEGLILNDPESVPRDPYTEGRKQPLRSYTTRSDFDKLKKFLKLDRKVLRFYCVWDDRDSMFGEMRPYVLHYFLVDDSIEIREVHKPNDGHDPFPVLLRRQRLPKDRNNVDSSFPMIVMELTDHEVKQWFTPQDFAIGKTLFIYGRRVLIYDCDEFTKNYYRMMHNVLDFTPIPVTGPACDLPKMELPPYNGFGSLEDSVQNCLCLVPQPPKKDFIKMLENDHKVLRYEAAMDSVRPEDRNRRFIISYRLSDDMVSIFEPPQRNSGIIGGKFLEATRISKPGSDVENPEFYGPGDFAVGATIQVFKHRFVITNCDEYVLNYLEKCADQYPGATINSIRAIHRKADA